MFVPFRQGLVKFQTDTNHNPIWLQRASGGQYVSLIVSPTATVVAFAHNSTDYLFEETRTIVQAWGPFTTAVDRWLFWDIDILTGARTFGSTLFPPIYDTTAPTSPSVDQHWFDRTNAVMNVWNGTRWDEKIRCFAAKYTNSAVLTPYAAGTQALLNNGANTGFILFDDDEKPIKKWRRDNKGVFLTSETPIISHVSRVSNVTLDGATNVCQAHHNIPQWSVVSYEGPNLIRLASSLDQTRPAVGIVKHDMNVGDVGIIHTSGYITNNNWNWTVPANTPLFVGLSGQIVTSVPQIGSIQQIGIVVDSDTVFVDFGKNQIILDES